MSDVPVLPDEDDEDALPMLMDSPQCVGFGIFVIWFASITINLGPTFLSGTMAANINHRPREPSCPLVQVEILKNCMVSKDFRRITSKLYLISRTPYKTALTTLAMFRVPSVIISSTSCGSS